MDGPDEAFGAPLVAPEPQNYPICFPARLAELGVQSCLSVNPLHLFPALVAAICLSACGGGTHLPSGVRTIGISPSARQAPQVLAPTGASNFSRMAEGEGLWAVSQLRATLARELTATERFQTVSPGKGDAEIMIESLRHGLIEVSGGSYGVSVTATVSITRGGKSLGTRELESVGTTVRSLRELEDPTIYREALQATLDKAAVEFVAEL